MATSNATLDDDEPRASSSHAPTAIPDEHRDAAKAIQVDMSITAMASSNKASFVTAVVMFFILVREVPWQRLSAWLAVVFAWTIAREVFIRRHLSRSRTTAESIAAELPFAVLMGGQAATWGALVAVTGFSKSPLAIASIALTLGGYVASASSVIATTPRVWALSTTLCMTPYLTTMLLSSDPVHRLLALGSVLFVLSQVGSLVNNLRHARTSIGLRFENQDLLALLERENANEAAARRIAERVSRDKSRFLAAASHDVRQPLSALGLFVDALHEQSLDSDAQRIVASIRLAHESLSALHGELLDIARLDSGAVPSRPRAVACAELVARLEAEAAPRAASKGLGLTLVARELTLFVDAEILLRILRNLVSNAIAYTPSGRVLVAFRKRGDEALIQVWDTGVGIAEADRELVFEELYQVGGRGGSREPGLGLGPAIVRRLARVLGTDVTLRSVVGKGSCFELRVPLAAKP